MPSWLPKVSPDLQTDPQRLPETPRVQIDQNVEKSYDSDRVRNRFWMPPARISFGAKCVEISFGFDAKIVKQVGEFEKNNKKHQILAPYLGKKNYFFASHLKGVSLKMGGDPRHQPTI